MRLVTPIAAAASTADSPMVSQARRSTRIVATTSLYPWSATSLTMAAPAGSAVRAAAATQTATPTVAAATRATGMRTARRQGETVSSKWTGIRRSTRTKTIIATVSTQNWVSARSGAPWTTKSRAVP